MGLEGTGQAEAGAPVSPAKTPGHAGDNCLVATLQEEADCADAASSAGCDWAALYRRTKKMASPQYDAEREELLSSPMYFVPAEGTAGHPLGSKRRIGTGYKRKI